MTEPTPFIEPGKPPTPLSDPIAGRYTTETSTGLGIRFHTTPDGTTPPPGDVPPNIRPFWMQIWGPAERRWLPAVKSFDEWGNLRPGDIVACFESLQDAEPREIILVLDEPNTTPRIALWGVKYADLSQLKEEEAFQAGLGETVH